LECLELQEFKVLSGSKMHHIYPNGDEIYSIEMVFLCEKYRGELKAQEEEVTEQSFFDLDNLPENISPHQVEVIRTLVEKYKNK